MENNPNNFIYSYTVKQPPVDLTNSSLPITYEVMYATGTQTFYILNATELNTFRTFSEFYQQPIQGLTHALNLPSDPVSDNQQQTAATKDTNSRTASVMSQASIFNAVMRNCIQGTDKNTFAELIWIPHDHSTPRFFYLNKDKLKYFKNKYVAQDEEAQKAIQNEKGGVSGAKLMQMVKNNSTGTLSLVNTKPLDDAIFSNLPKILQIDDVDHPKVFFGNPNDPNNVFVADGEAQVLRYTGSASVGVIASVKNRSLSLNAQGNAAINIAKGKVDVAQLTLPCEEGYHVMPLFQDRNGAWRPFDMGYLRVELTLSLTGFVGASILGCASIGYKMSPAGKIQVVGINPGESGNPDPTKDSSAGIITNATAFLGVQAGGDVGCALQWRNPEKGHDWDEVASLSAEGDLSAGLGLNGSFVIDYNFTYKKFYVHVAAGMTWGLGCSGSVNLIIDADTAVAFVQFIYHKIMSQDYSYVGFVKDLAFKLLVDLFTMTLFMPEIALIDAVINKSGSITEWWYSQLASLETSVNLNQIAAMVNVISTSPERLTFTPPEVKGRMLYILTDPRMPVALLNAMIEDGARSATGFTAIVSAYLEAVESAILTILSYIQSQNDYNNVMTHMSLDPATKIALPESEHRLFNNLISQGYDAHRLATFHVALIDHGQLAIYSSKPAYNQPVKPNQDILNIRGPTTSIQGY